MDGGIAPELQDLGLDVRFEAPRYVHDHPFTEVLRHVSPRFGLEDVEDMIPYEPVEGTGGAVQAGEAPACPGDGVGDPTCP